MWSKMTFLAFISSKCKHFGLIILILKKQNLTFVNFKKIAALMFLVGTTKTHTEFSKEQTERQSQPQKYVLTCKMFFFFFWARA